MEDTDASPDWRSGLKRVLSMARYLYLNQQIWKHCCLKGEGDIKIKNITWKRSNNLLKGWTTTMLFEEVLARSSDLTLLPKTEGLQTHLHSSQERDFTTVQQMSFLRKGTDSLNKYIWKSKATCDDLASWLPLASPFPTKTRCFGFFKD